MGPSCLAVVALVVHAAPPPPVLHPAAGAVAEDTSVALVQPAADLPREHGLRAPPVCAAEICQPRVAVPGQDPQLNGRGRRTELALTVLQRTHVEPVVTIARLLARTGLRLEYSPRRLDAARGLERAGWGEVLVGVRWRLDASNRPVWLTSPPPR